MLQYLKVFHSLFPPISQPSLKGGCKQPTGHPPVDTLTVNYQVAQATDLWFTNCFRMSSFKHVGFQTMYGNHEFPLAWNQEQNSQIPFFLSPFLEFSEFAMLEKRILPPQPFTIWDPGLNENPFLFGK